MSLGRIFVADFITAPFYTMSLMIFSFLFTIPTKNAYGCNKHGMKHTH